MQVMAEQDMAELLRCCLPELTEIEAEYIRDCWLKKPRTSLKRFAEQWQLPTKELQNVRKSSMERLKHLLALKGIHSTADLAGREEPI